MREQHMHIRSMRADDVPAVARLMASDGLWQRYGITEAVAAKRLREGLVEGATIAVAAVDSAITGVIWYVARGVFGLSGYIKLIGVRPEWRRVGVGRTLMEYAEAALFTESDDVFVLVPDGNHDAQAFCGRLGYVEVGAIPDYVVQGVTELVFRKRRDL